jgi:outer membrane autotransporter protein
MKVKSVLPRAGLAALALACSSALAQTDCTTGALCTFVNTPGNGASALQIAAAGAVQRMCAYLKSAGATPANPGSGPVGDLFLRCNELVGNASVLNSNPNGSPPTEVAAPPRSLGLSGPQLLAALQQVSGNEVTAQGDLSTQVSAGQFSNISGRLSALRLGNFGALSRGQFADLGPSGSSELTDAAVGPIPVGDDSVSLDSWQRSGLHPAVFNYSVGALDGSGSGAASGYGSGSNYAATPASAAGSASGSFDAHWGWFAQGTYDFGHRSQSAAEDAFDFHAGSFTAGIDYNFGNAVLGVSGGYDDYRASFANNGTVTGGDTTVKGGSGSIYGAWFGDQFFVNGIATYGSPQTTMNRTVFYPSTNTCAPPATCPGVNQTYYSNPGGRDYAAALSIGHDTYFAGGAWDLETSLSVSYQRVETDAFEETPSNPNGVGSGLALSYDEQAIESLRSILAFDLSHPYSTSFGVVSPDLRLEWQHEFKDDERTLAAKYAYDPTSIPGVFANCASCFSILSDKPSSDFGVAGIGVTMLFAHRVQAYAYYEALLGESHLTSNAVTIGLRGQF